MAEYVYRVRYEGQGLINGEHRTECHEEAYALYEQEACKGLLRQLDLMRSHDGKHWQLLERMSWKPTPKPQRNYKGAALWL